MPDSPATSIVGSQSPIASGTLTPANVARLILAAQALIRTIDYPPIRKAALECGQPLYEKSAELIDAIAACRAAARPAVLP